jgi:hypothetical protein
MQGHCSRDFLQPRHPFAAAPIQHAMADAASLLILHTDRYADEESNNSTLLLGQFIFSTTQ